MSAPAAVAEADRRLFAVAAHRTRLAENVERAAVVWRQSGCSVASASNLIAAVDRLVAFDAASGYRP